MKEIQEESSQKKAEISIKDLLIKVQEWGRHLLNKWLLIVIFGAIGAGIGFTFSTLMKPKYEGELTFVMEDNRGNPFSMYAGLASQFGIDLGGSASTGIFEGDNVLGFLKSRLMIEKTLLEPVIIDGKETSLADLYIDFKGLRKSWDKNPRLKTISFPVNVNRQSFSLQQDSILNIIHEKILKENLEIKKPDPKLAFISVKCTTLNESFSKVFTERLVKEATDFYIETKTKRNKTNVDRLQQQADSLEQQLNRKTFSAAVARDLNQNPARQAANVTSEVALRDKMVLQTMYSEVVKNLELSKIAMAQETPVIQIIDTPILPLKKVKLGRLKGLLIGGFIGGFLIVAFLMTQMLYREIMDM